MESERIPEKCTVQEGDPSDARSFYGRMILERNGTEGPNLYVDDN
jgi:hypothetical protein